MNWKLTYVHTKTCTQLLVAGLFIIVKSQEHLRYSWIDDWINSLGFLHMAAYYLMKEGNDQSSHRKMWGWQLHFSKWKNLMSFQMLWFLWVTYWSRRDSGVSKRHQCLRNCRQGRAEWKSKWNTVGFRAVKWFWMIVSQRAHLITH